MLHLLALALLSAGPPSPSSVVVGAFSEAAPGGTPAGWEPLRFGNTRPSSYRLVQDGGATVVRAEAAGAASGLVRRIRVDPARFPVLRWQWKVEGVVPGGDYTRRDGDDYAARIYVIFDYPVSALSFGDQLKYRALQALGYRDLPTRALNYVWANQPSARAVRPNAYTDWVQMVPVERGAANAGGWQQARRNVADDYRAAFGEEPPPVAAVAIMTDTDDTGERAVAYYGDLVMEAE